jgi:hypothetical protein
MIKALIVLAFIQVAIARDVNVRSASELSNALKAAKPGDNIILADGNNNGNFVAAASGTSSNKIIIRGSLQSSSF